VSKRPPLLGYNHNVRHAGRLFHVQTEDSGPARPVLSTHLFIEGTILSSQRTPYSLDEPETVTQKRMQEQHKGMLKRLRDGLFDSLPEVQRFPASAGAHKQGDAAPVAKEGGGDTPKTAVTKTTPEASTKPDAGSSPILSPVPPPPVGPPSSTVGLAERLKKLSAAASAAVPPVPVQSSKVVIAPELITTPDEAVVEIEAAADDDEPALSFEAEADDDMLSENTPLPKARPLAAYDEESTAQFGASQMPTVQPPVVSRPVVAPSPVVSPIQRSIPTYTIPPELFKPRPTAEGVTLKRSPPVPVNRAPTDPIRTTIVRARPTRPAPLAPTLKPGQVLPPDSLLDPELLSFLGRLRSP